ncbi:MAG: peroxiredoxin [Calditrichia bacterium]
MIRVMSIIIIIGLSINGFTSANPSRFTENGLKIGDKAPNFYANTDEGELWKLPDHIGKKFLVIYFYPAAMTSGCTKQACSYRDNKDNLSKLDVEVVGVSGDPVKNLQIFKKEHRLNFTLLSDVNGDIARLFGVPTRQGGTVTRNVDSREVSLTRSVTEARWTFVVDKSGKIVYINTEVDPEKDSKQIMEFIAGISKKAK